MKPLREGECIYCQRPSNELTAEHGLPSGLGGAIVVPRASCEACRKITHQFETVALRHTLGPGRYKLGIKGKKGSRRPSVWPAYRIDKVGVRHKVDVPTADLPFFMMLPTFALNPEIHGPPVEATEAPSSTKAILLSEDPELVRAKLKEYGAETVESRLDHLAFARMLTKIALCYCVKEYGYGGFVPVVGPLILGQTEAFGRFVGSTQTSPSKDFVPDWGAAHRIGDQTFNREPYWIRVRIELFHNLHGPAYYVMAGVLAPTESTWLQLSEDS